MHISSELRGLLSEDDLIENKDWKCLRKGNRVRKYNLYGLWRGHAFCFYKGVKENKSKFSKVMRFRASLRRCKSHLIQNFV
jgi:hypothetical protein